MGPLTPKDRIESAPERRLPTPRHQAPTRQAALTVHTGVLQATIVERLRTILRDLETMRRGGPHGAGPGVETTPFEESAAQVLSDLDHVLTEFVELTETSAVDGVLADLLTAALRRFERRTGIRAALVEHVTRPIRVHGWVAQHVLRIVEEALHNVWQHSSAGSVEVSLTEHDDLVTVAVCDDGTSDDAQPGEGLGQLGMRQRAALLGGSLAIETVAEGGTTIRLQFLREGVR